MRKLVLSCLFAIFFAPFLPAQLSVGGDPVFLNDAFQMARGPISLSAYDLPAPDLEALRRRNEQQPDNPLFSSPILVSLNLENAGQWLDLGNGDRLWLLELRSPGAQGLAVLYDQFYLPPGAKLFMYDPEGNTILGAYTAQNNKKSGRFVTGFIPGERAVLEYYEPKFQRGKGVVSIFRVDHAFGTGMLDDDPVVANGFGYGESDTCQVNVNCPVGADWQDEKRGVCRVRMVLEEGMGWCSGTLVNNTENDGTPYVLTGFHCQDGYTPLYDLWRFDFQYEGAGCANPAEEPSFFSIVGSEFRAGRQATDFLLLEISIPIPGFLNVYFNGWNRQAAAPSSGVLIHHPRADIKKISFDNDPPTIHPVGLNWSNGVNTPANHHLRAILDTGSFQEASSGSPLFNSQGQIVGQLHGGFLGCTQVTTFSGRFHLSWDAGATPAERLKEWLDPGNTGAMSLDGYQPPAPTTVTLSGRVKTSNNNKGVAGVTVVCLGPDTLTQVTDTTGTYSFSDLPIGENYILGCIKNTGPANGVTTLDQVFIKKHILLIDPLTNPYAIIASDANNSTTVTTVDMVEISKVILTIAQSFTNNTSWRFVPSEYVFPEPQNPFSQPIPNGFVFPNLIFDVPDLDFYGIKVGDANFSANPYQ
jgi:lysyl endopeptidase